MLLPKNNTKKPLKLMSGFKAILLLFYFFIKLKSIIKHLIVNLENNNPKSDTLFGIIRNKENTGIVTIL
jgi:hypothetical protein